MAVFYAKMFFMAEKRLSLGKYQFDSYTEFRDAQEDVQKIDIIKRELDLKDPEVVLRLYNMIRDGEITFKTAVGKEFFVHISDLVAGSSDKILAEQTDVEQIEKSFRFQKILGRVLISVAALAFAYVGYVEIRDYRYTNKLKKLQSQVTMTSSSADRLAALNGLNDLNLPQIAQGEETEEEVDETTEEPILIDRSTLEVLPEFIDLYNSNPDMVGWINIPDTEINYPVMQTIADDDFYIDHDFYGAKDSNGTIFVDSRCDIVNQPSNTILYGHNMRSGMMFGSLKKYQKKDYFDEHQYVYFDTIYEHRIYQVVAVCLSKVSFQDETGFRYYNYIEGNNHTEFQEFYDNISSLNVHEGAVNLAPSDKILTLSTCNNYTEDGRLFIVAKRVQ